MKQFVQSLLLAVTVALDANQNAFDPALEPTGDTAHGETAGWNYIKHGDDWKDITGLESCGAAKMQSPIDLVSKGSSEFKYDIVAPEKDKLQTSYSNQTPGNVVFNGHTTQVNLDISGYSSDPVLNANEFTSSIPQEFWGTSVPMKFTAQRFNFHAGSEHTIDGVRQDLEMHSIHFNAETDHSTHGFPDAALGIFFSVENYNAKTTPEEDAIIDNFFDTLQLSIDVSATPTWTSTAIPYANLINLMDWNNRWVYKGSVTTPPCETMVYWNVLATVYPVKQRHLDNFKKQLAKAKGYDAPTLDTLGNFRNVQKIDGQDVKYVFKAREASATEEKEKNTVLIIVIGVLGFLTFAFCVTTVAFYTKANAASKISGSNEGGEQELTNESTLENIVIKTDRV